MVAFDKNHFLSNIRDHRHVAKSCLNTTIMLLRPSNFLIRLVVGKLDRGQLSRILTTQSTTEDSGASVFASKYQNDMLDA